MLHPLIGFQEFPKAQIKGQLGALKLPLCAGSRKGPDHKGLLYTVLPCIFAKGCFHGLNPGPLDHMTTTLPVTPKLPFNSSQRLKSDNLLDQFHSNIDYITLMIFQIISQTDERKKH